MTARKQHDPAENDSQPAADAMTETPSENARDDQRDENNEAGARNPEQQESPANDQDKDPESQGNEVDEWRNLALRAQADLENYRKRMSREMGEIRRFAATSLLQDLLPVLDNFDFGLQAARGESTDSSIYQGMLMVRRQFEEFLGNSGVEEVPIEGKPFDPNLHEAVASEAHDEIPEGHIIKPVRKGYRLHDRLLRPASVVVSKGPQSED